MHFDAIALVRSRAETTYRLDGSPERTLATIQDISHLRAAEEESRRLGAELRHADRAAHIGALTASLSHELNQPLTGILANSQAGLRLLARESVDPAELRAILESIVRDDKRAASVISNLRLLLRREEPARERVDIAEAITEVLALFKSELEANNVHLEAGLEPGCDTLGVKTQIQQVWVNLLSNAVHALQDRVASDRKLEVKLVRVSSGQAEIWVRDNGAGISPDRLPGIFEPFFSTKTDGLGMGLAITRSIVEAHGGEIAVRTQAAGGTGFRVSLPVDPARQARPASESKVAQDDRSMAKSDVPITESRRIRILRGCTREPRARRGAVPCAGCADARHVGH